MKELNHDILIELGYKKYTWNNDDNDEVITWNKDGISLFESIYSNKPDFLFAGNLREDGSFKSGWSIKTDTQLNKLENALKNL